MKVSIPFLAICSFTTFSYAQDSYDYSVENDTIKRLDGITVSADAVVGSKFKAKNISGSTYYVSQEELNTFNYGDINRILRTVPGVNIVEEEGFGMRPSIGLRGTNPTRTSKITLMEDGVLIAPAPYSAPAAYYFPTVNRIQAFEILKGGSQIQYGPFTTGGAINMVSTQIPNDFQARIMASMGSFDTRNTYMNIGDNFKNFAYLVEYNNRNSDGFKTIDYSDQSTGFDGNDYVAKFRINTNTDAKVFQSLTAKFQLSDEASNETYLGLTQEDFNKNPYRRYLGSEADRIDTKHQQVMLTHFIIPADNITVTTKAYKNKFSRNWYKLHDVRRTDPDTGESENISLKNILDNPQQNIDLYNAITGITDSENNALRVRANNRSYGSEGIQTVANFKFNGGEINHDLDLGLRYHKDYEDRFQWDDRYTIRNRALFRTSAGTPGTQENRIEEAEALAAHVLYNFKYKNLTLTPGLRYENILRRSLRYQAGNLERDREGVDITSNRFDAVIPGMGALYSFNDNYSVFTSVHRGFSPAGTREDSKVESSTNVEAGFRMNKKGLSGEIIGFFNDYSNLLGADTNAGGGTGTGDLLNAGSARVMGLEFLLTYNPLEGISEKFRLPVMISYTYTDTKLTSNFSSVDGDWGVVESGDEIPFISKHQLAVVSSLDHKKFTISLSGKFNDRFRTSPGQGIIPAGELVKAYFVMDAAARYHLTEKVSLMSNINNVFDNKYAVSRIPAGLRPGMPFAINFGIVAQF